MGYDVYLKTVRTKMEGNCCPKCGQSAEGGTAFDIDQPPPRDPEPGDWALCCYCSTLNRYGEDRKLRPITEQERAEVMADPRLSKVLKYAQLAAKRTRRQWQ